MEVLNLVLPLAPLQNRIGVFVIRSPVCITISGRLQSLGLGFSSFHAGTRRIDIDETNGNRIGTNLTTGRPTHDCLKLLPNL